MTEEPGPVRAPEFPSGVAWLQGGPLTLAELRGRPVLIDFWDYTCINCLHTLPYLKEWDRRYQDLGLAIVGVHAPEFSFAHNADHVRRAVAEHGLAYAIAVDNDYAIWQAYANRYWPAKATCATTTSARAPTTRPSGRSRSCSAKPSWRSSCPAWSRPCATRTSP